MIGFFVICGIIVLTIIIELIPKKNTPQMKPGIELYLEKRKMAAPMAGDEHS